MINPMKTRGERLKARRIELGLTLKQVSEAVNISLPGVQNLERGDVMPSLVIGLALARCYRKPVEWVLYGTESDPDRVPVIGTTATGPDSAWQPGELTRAERFLPFVNQRNSVYALMIDGQIHGAAYQPGDFLLADALMTPVPGEDVLACDNSGVIEIFKLARIDGEQYYLDGPSQHRVIRGKTDLKFVHQVVGTIKSFMVEGV